ncbi:Unknown protein, partial [Striga hermonthica]
GIEFLVTFVYASPNAMHRRGLWQELQKLAMNIHEPWLLGGDFNCILRPSERTGGAPTRSPVSQEFSTWLFNNTIEELRTDGVLYTWERGGLKQKLDRFVANSAWILTFHKPFVQHLPRINSDHFPLLVRVPSDPRPVRTRKNFNFLASWLLHDGFAEVVRGAWSGKPYTEASRCFQERATHWNYHVFGNIFQRKKRLLRRIGGVQRELQKYTTPRLHSMEEKFRKELAEIALQEELLMLQKSQRDWSLFGDRNTSFYHRAVKQRRSQNRITFLRDDDGSMVEDPSSIQRLALNFFRNVYSHDEPLHAGPGMANFFPKLDMRFFAIMNRDVSDSEIFLALKDMKPLKASGPDGLHAMFFQRQWNTVGSTVCDMIRSFLNGGDLPVGLNETSLVLIPKVQNPSSIRNF